MLEVRKNNDFNYIKEFPVYRNIVDISDKLNNLNDEKTGGNEKNIESILMLRDVVNKILVDGKYNYKGVCFDFFGDVWDFSALQDDEKQNLYKRHFHQLKGIDKDLDFMFRLYTLNDIVENSIYNRTTVSRNHIIKNIIKHIDSTYKSLDSLTSSDIAEWCENKNYIRTINNKTYFYSFMKFCMSLGIEIKKECIDYLSERDNDYINALRLKNKTRLVDENDYKTYVNLLYELIHDEELELYKRGYAILAYIITQTGIRPSEAILLRPYDLIYKKYMDMELPRLHYRCPKTTRNKEGLFDEGECSVTKKLVEVYELAKDLFKDSRKELEVEFLVPNIFQREESIKSIKQIQLTTFVASLFKVYKERFKHPEMFDGNTKLHSNYSIKNTSVNPKESIKYINFKQCRVYVATLKQNKGVPDSQIALQFNHHSRHMESYYCRSTHEVQEDVTFSKEIIEQIVKSNYKMIGTKADAYTNKIRKITSNDVNVVADVDTLIEKVLNEMPIRRKATGFCMKSSKDRKCEMDAATDEFMCAFDICVNHCFFFYSLPYSYSKFEELKKTYEYNKKNNYKNAAQAELKKIRMVIKNELIPEIEETNNMITQKGKERIIKDFPKMERFINDLNFYKQEVLEWQNVSY